MPRSRPGASRRSVLAGSGAVAGFALAGCLGFGAARGSDPSSERPRRSREPVSLLAAGSLNNALENGLAPALADRGIALRVEARGSAEAARLVASGARDPDIVSVADVALFDGPLHPDWYAEFATNAMAIAYDPDTPGGARLAAAGAERWYEPMVDGTVSFGRTDPAVDPLGYRTLFALELATDYYDTAVDLREAIPAPDQVYPETQLLAQFETGAVEAAFVYRNMALERDYAVVDLPGAIDLGDPSLADEYARATYTLPGGKTVRGGVISYGTTVRGPTVRGTVPSAFDAHVTGDYLTDYGFAVPEDYPRYTGDVPDEIPRR